jgi:hypothetical protein
MTDIMTRQLPVAIAAMAGMVGLIAALSGPGTAQRRLQAVAQNITGALEAPVDRLLPLSGQIAGLSAGPRIIHVPPNFGDGAGGGYEDGALTPDQPVYRDERRHVAPPAQLQPAGPGDPQQDSSLRDGPSHSPAKGSLTPIYPTPRWNIGRPSGKPPAKTQADAQTPR